MISVVAWLVAGIALWFTRGVLDVFTDGGRSIRVAMLPSAPELMGLITFSLIIAGGVAAIVRRWTSAADARREALLQISLPLFALALVISPYLPWVPDLIQPLRALAGPIVYVVWLVIGGLAIITAVSERAAFLAHRDSSRTGWSLFVIALATAAISATAALRLRGTLTAVALSNGTIGTAWGDRAIWLTVTLTVVMAILTWRWVHALTGSIAASIFTWAALFLSAPIVFTSVAILPDIPAAFCVLVALAWRAEPRSSNVNWLDFLARGLIISALPWLSVTYAAMAAAAAIVLGIRAMKDPKAVMALLVPFTVSLLRRFAVGHSPMVFSNPLTGMLGLLFDQEFGVLPYAPALLMGFVGLWQMLRAGDPIVRQRAREITIVFVTLLLSAATLAEWWGGAAPPGHPLVPALPLLALPIAWSYLGAQKASVERSICHLVVLAGAGITLTMLLSSDGALIVQDRDGSSRLLQSFTTLWPVWQMFPSIAAGALRNAVPLILLWIVVAWTVGWISRRNSLEQHGASALMGFVNVAAALLVIALLSPAIARSAWGDEADDSARLPQPETRSRMPLLDNFDSLARPHAVIYRPFRIATASDIPPLLKMAAGPEYRAGSQPVKVLLNARYALAAGDYTVEIGDVPAGMPLQGTIGLQVGRIGLPLREWHVDLPAGSAWRSSFSLPVDAEFVGFVTSGSLDSATSLRITPRAVVDSNNRESSFRGSPRLVLSSVGFPHASIFFHDEDVYPEKSGFWVHGESTAFMTVAPDQPDRSVILRVHSGAAPNNVTFATTTWGERVELTPGTPRDVQIPPPARPGPFLLRVVSEKGFVPAAILPGNTDHRILGCWIEVVQE